jgi:hypothetical protein
MHVNPTGLRLIDCNPRSGRFGGIRKGLGIDSRAIFCFDARSAMNRAHFSPTLSLVRGIVRGACVARA